MKYLIRHLGIWAVAIALCAILPVIFSSDYAISLLSQMGIAIIFSLSYNMILGQGGMLSFGHAVYFGIGGFLAMHGINLIAGGTLPIPLELAPLIGGLGGLIVGILFGWLSTERSGTTFALISLGIGELIAASALLLPGFFGGEEGVSTDRMVENTITPFDFGQQIEVYYLIACWMLLCIVLMYLQTKTPLGRVANAVRDNPERAAFIGYNTRMVRTIQFALASFFSGIAGGLFAINYEIITAEMIGAIPSANVLMMTYIGGIGHFFGPIIGAVLVTFMQLTLSGFTHAWQLYFGLLFVSMILWAPTGLAGIIMNHEPAWKAGLMKKLIPSYTRATLAALVMFLGIMTLIEINYHLSLSIHPKDPMSLFGISFKAQSPAGWIIAIALIAVGFFFFKRGKNEVKNSWMDVHQAIKTGGK
ncbi:MAG: branched-chain amino acid ABC transporter permease [Proteobacteria bacterium]|nr:branched-chain amino acid ABC transporter permease [Pseudomonadota bacterium]MBU1386762.1 branched-chain amino acid ABC transporter permease [Pseudomonadota bacterium]MBU1544706.1 branched-chain amino acid ABC transporter permease [Pseudomonadota bacterium]MBU2430112.1 branched-chain amino acid ABC transporter permease [Pseudomonadota bacterium]MBU2481875.1 branched-chain amino acid ABC transporter permease [Pseudomonadota bacterium]